MLESVLLIAASVLTAVRRDKRTAINALPIGIGLVVSGFLIWIHPTQWTFIWLPYSGFELTETTDALREAARGVVLAVAFAVLLYAIGYQKRESGGARFFAFYGVFVAAMLTFIGSTSLLLIYISWEAMSVMSFLLIGFRTESPLASGSAMRAFVTTRFGDLFLLLGIGLTYHLTGSLSILSLASNGMAGAAGGLALALLVVGAAAKSAALPFSSWLPSAMVAPTPVSALLHSATLVAAGPFLLAELSAAFGMHGVVRVAALFVMVITALTSAGMASLESDEKRVLAYSTIEQLAQASLAAIAGLPLVAFFILAAHAAAKPLLFFAAGLQQVGTGSTSFYDASRKARRQIGMVAVIIGVASLVGLPPFFSSWTSHQLWGAMQLRAQAWNYIGIMLSLMSGFYLTRFVILIFPLEDRAFDNHSLGKWMPATAAACAVAGGGASAIIGSMQLLHHDTGDATALLLPATAMLGVFLAVVMGHFHNLLPLSIPVFNVAQKTVEQTRVPHPHHSLRHYGAVVTQFDHILLGRIRSVNVSFNRALFSMDRIDRAMLEGITSAAMLCARPFAQSTDSALEAAIERLARSIFPLGDRLVALITGNVSAYVQYTAFILTVGAAMIVAIGLVLGSIGR